MNLKNYEGKSRQNLKRLLIKHKARRDELYQAYLTIKKYNLFANNVALNIISDKLTQEITEVNYIECLLGESELYQNLYNHYIERGASIEYIKKQLSKW